MKLIATPFQHMEPVNEPCGRGSRGPAAQQVCRVKQSEKEISTTPNRRHPSHGRLLKTGNNLQDLRLLLYATLNYVFCDRM